MQFNVPVKILTEDFIRHDAGLNRVKACGLDDLTKVPDHVSMVNACIPMLLYALQDVVMVLLQGSIFIKGPIPLIPSVTSLGKLLLRTSFHVVYIAGAQVIIVNEPESQSPITVLLSWLEVGLCVRSLEYCNHVLPNQRSVRNERVGEWTNLSRVSSKRLSPTENQSLSNHLLIVCTLLASISVVHGITCGNRRYQIHHQPIAEGLSIYSAKYYYVLFHRFQGIGPVPWIGGRYHFRVLVSFLRVPLMVHHAELGEINICVCERAPNPFEVIDIINHAL